MIIRVSFRRLWVLSWVGLVLCGPGTTRADIGAHAEVVCAVCHGAGTPAGNDPTRVRVTCTGCHTEATLPRQTRVGPHATGERHCQDCHTFHAARQLKTRAGTLDLEALAGVDPGHCLACHDKRGDLQDLSPGHREAGKHYHTDPATLRTVSPSAACLLCHAPDAASSWRERTVGRPLAVNPHASHPCGIRVIPGAGDASNWIAAELDPRLPLFDGRLECQTCHLLTADTEDRVMPFPAKYDLCQGCHRHHGDKERARDLMAAMVR